MQTDSFQLSHEELLVLLGMLGLPAPLALGPQPAAGYAPAGARALLVGALGSLVARGLVETGDSAASAPRIEPWLMRALRACALAEGCLIIAERRRTLRRTLHLSVAGDAMVLHSSPLPRVHRFETLATADAAGERLAAALGGVTGHAIAGLGAPAAALCAAMDAAEDDARPEASALLVGAGVPLREAGPFLDALGRAPGRFAIGGVRRLRGAQPEAKGAVAICGSAGTWWGSTTPAAPLLRLVPADRAALRAELDAMFAWVCAA